VAETRTQLEGELRFVRGSGSGNTFATAATPVSGIIGFSQSFSYNSAQTVTTIMNRGIPDHHKVTQKSPVEVTFQCYFTGNYPTGITGSGATVPFFHLEHRASAAEIGNGTTGVYHLFIGAALESVKLSEGAPNTIDLTYRCLAMVGPTGSGYLS
jgi:hypothetical protein